MITALGLTAATLTTGSFLPQVFRSWRTKRVADLSWYWLAMFATGLAAWTTYGAIRGDVPVIASNGVTLVLTFILIALKIRY